MRKGLVHEQDFFVLGPMAWNVVKLKFGQVGYGLIEIARPCVPAKNNGLLAIELRPEESEDNKPFQIEIPAAGRFAYEQVMKPADETSKSALVPQDENHNVSIFCSLKSEISGHLYMNTHPSSRLLSSYQYSGVLGRFSGRENRTCSSRSRRTSAAPPPFNNCC